MQKLSKPSPSGSGAPCDPWGGDLCLGDAAGDEGDVFRQGEQAKHGNSQDLESGVGDFEMRIQEVQLRWVSMPRSRTRPCRRAMTLCRRFVAEPVIVVAK